MMFSIQGKNNSLWKWWAVVSHHFPFGEPHLVTLAHQWVLRIKMKVHQCELAFCDLNRFSSDV